MFGRRRQSGHVTDPVRKFGKLFALHCADGYESRRIQGGAMARLTRRIETKPSTSLSQRAAGIAWNDFVDDRAKSHFGSSTPGGT
jgi:hypothetical protein